MKPTRQKRIICINLVKTCCFSQTVKMQKKNNLSLAVFTCSILTFILMARLDTKCHIGHWTNCFLFVLCMSCSRKCTMSLLWQSVTECYASATSINTRNTQKPQMPVTRASKHVHKAYTLYRHLLCHQLLQTDQRH